MYSIGNLPYSCTPALKNSDADAVVLCFRINGVGIVHTPICIPSMTHNPICIPSMTRICFFFWNAFDHNHLEMKFIVRRIFFFLFLSAQPLHRYLNTDIR